jgi:hypothetical protein
VRARQLTVLDRPTWRARADAHRARVDAWIVPHLERRERHVKHPVEDFLFTYYSYSPARLRCWHPGVGVALAGADNLGADYRTTPVGSTVDIAAVRGRRSRSIAWIRELLTATGSRDAQFGCFGMHEWAMVYRQPREQIRHHDRPLRLGPAGTDRVVEASTIRCSHFDAYRFFTEPARPLNVLRPTRDTQVANEQPGCLHANMDVYKWAYTLSPLTGAELVADCFALARDIRGLDMRASPYDLADLGYPPLRVETPDGRAEYVAAQRRFADRAAPLRAALLDVISAC